MHNIICCCDLSKSYDSDTQKIMVLDKINLNVSAGKNLAILGASGSGKSTLLSLIGGLDQPSSGSITIDGRELGSCSEQQLSYLRNTTIGFVYQFHHLLAEFSALENVAIPLLIKGMSANDAYVQAKQYLAAVNMGARETHKPAALSGGERQRVAIARGLVTKPALVLMDEPTGNLDVNTSSKVQKLIVKLSCEYNTSFVIATHDINLAHAMDNVWELTQSSLHAIATI